MRAFVAIFPPPGVRAEALAGAIEAFQRPDSPTGLPTNRVRWTRPENVHLTLKFLGEVREEMLEEVRDALRGTCRRYAPFEVWLAGLGAFPSPRRARILWAGVGAGADRLNPLAAGIEDTLAPFGFAREGRAFTPHLTLGRIRGRPAGFEPPAAMLNLGFRVESVDLVRSTLSRGGSVYEVVEAFRLEGGQGTTRRR